MLKAQEEGLDNIILYRGKLIEHEACKTRLKVDGIKEETRAVPEIVGSNKLKHRLLMAASQREQHEDKPKRQALVGKDKRLIHEKSHCWRDTSLS